MSLDLVEHVHRRLNPLNGDWVLVSPHRSLRPWQGREEEVDTDKPPAYDPDCYLCPGNMRAGGIRNPEYKGTFVFDNDFAALRPDTPSGTLNVNDLLIAEAESGICRVICYSPRHDISMPDMEPEALRGVVDLWAEQFAELGRRDDINYVQIFENKGEMMGCSNRHPHGQIWAQKTVPDEPAKETIRQQQYFDKYRSTMLADYLDLELRLGERIVSENDHFVALVPFWAFWPFETMIVSRRPAQNLPALDDEERDALALILKDITVRYDALFNCSFPYSAGLHQAPSDGQPHPAWHLHMHFYPPLLRSATVKKIQSRL